MLLAQKNFTGRESRQQVNCLCMQDMMGGFFGLELPEYGNFPYTEDTCCAWLNSGRAALEVLLTHLPRPERLWIPRFICDTVLQAPEHLNIPIARYSCTSRLEPVLPDVGDNDLVLLVNYFGLTQDYVQQTASRFHGRCVVDATTALYCPPLPGIPTFYSPRKFCGVADGGIACAPFPLTNLPGSQASSSRNSLFLLERLESGAAAALPASECAEQALCATPCRMSRLTRRLLNSIDFEKSAHQRLLNYSHLHQALHCINRLPLPEHPGSAPMCYPLVSGIPGLRDTLIDAGVALPLYWPEVLEATQPDDAENILSRQLLPLPLDQRYGEEDMKRLLELILG